jgi:glycine/D-amino acid oxidase-like deaminating enzyme
MTHAVVIGGGPAGAALALLFSPAGRDVVLAERKAGPVDKVCGERRRNERGLGLPFWVTGCIFCETRRPLPSPLLRRRFD